MSVQEIVRAFKELSPEERQQAMADMVKFIPPEVSPSPPRRKRFMDFMGAGAYAYDGIDAQEQMRQLRSEWEES